MGKALLSESEKQNLPLIYQKQFLFNLGVTRNIRHNPNNHELDCILIEGKLR